MYLSKPTLHMIRIKLKIGKINIRFKQKISDARASTSAMRANRVNIIRFIYRTIYTTVRGVPKFPKIHSLPNNFLYAPSISSSLRFIRNRACCSHGKCPTKTHESVSAVIIIQQAFPRDPTVQLTRLYLSSVTKRWERQHACDNASCATCILVNCSKPRLMILCVTRSIQCMRSFCSQLFSRDRSRV